MPYFTLTDKVSTIKTHTDAPRHHEDHLNNPRPQLAKWPTDIPRQDSRSPPYESSKSPPHSLAPWERVGGVTKVRSTPPPIHTVPFPLYTHPPASSNTSRADLDPIRRADRKWSIYALIAYWFSDAFNAATWEFASSILAIGLSYKDALGIVATGFLIVSVVISLNGATGVLYHAPFPVLARAGWGFWGSYGTEISSWLGGLDWG